MKKLECRGSKFYLDSSELQIISGAIHYFRLTRESWEDRLLKAKYCGLNTIETYIPWNIHQPEENEFCFEGSRDFSHFVCLAGSLGLHVILRPCPYICAEWDFGGLPYWLMRKQNMQLRCMDESFLNEVDHYFDVLVPKLLPLLSTNGGPVIALQVENEYGSYGNDSKYMHYLKDAYIKRGVDVLLFTSDGTCDSMLTGGMTADTLATINFGSAPADNFAKLREYQKDKPEMCMEYWGGWFDHWGAEHHVRETESFIEPVKYMLDKGISFNLYMFCGGTNFAFYNGANCFETFMPVVTSYDYDAPISEDGRCTDKYYRLREMISEYYQVPECKISDSISKAYGVVELVQCAPLFDNLDVVCPDVYGSVIPMTMEQAGLDYGFILYKTTIKAPMQPLTLRIPEVRDLALVYLDGEYLGSYERGRENNDITVTVREHDAELSVLIENMGRVDYGIHLWDAKGLLRPLHAENQSLFHYKNMPLRLNEMEHLRYTDSKNNKTPAFMKGSFFADVCADTFLDTGNLVKGTAWINGNCLGRYWNRGPQKKLFIPAAFVKRGDNEIVVFELYGGKPEVSLSDTPDLGAI